MQYGLHRNGMETCAAGPTLIKLARKPASTIKDKKRARLRREAEEAATHLRHRIADNERRHPEIFRHIRSAEFLAAYERSTGEPWDSRYESDMDEMRCRIVMATMHDERTVAI